MATIAEQLTSLANTKTAIKDAIVAKGVTVADDTPFSGYAAKIGEIQGGGGAPATRLGISIDDLLGYVNADGVYNMPNNTNANVFDGTGIKNISKYGLAYKFYNHQYNTIQGSVLQKVLLPDLVCDHSRVNADGCCMYAFYGQRELEVVDISSLEHAQSYNMFTGAFSWCYALKHSGLKNLKTISGLYAFQNAYGTCTNLEETGLDNLEEITGANACDEMFSGDTKIRTTGLYMLKKISGGSACKNMFSSCAGLVDPCLTSLESTTAGQACYYMFYECTSITYAMFDCLVEVKGAADMEYMFYGCTGLIAAYYPSLTYVAQNGFANRNTSTYGKYKGCNAMQEIHFRKDAQAVIESIYGYSNRWGATNATIYFDLIGTITVGGVAYARDEKQSIRVDGTKTFVAWKDVNDNVVYTSYANNAEPAVGTAVYSDAGTTQVGTVEGVA